MGADEWDGCSRGKASGMPEVENSSSPEEKEAGNRDMQKKSAGPQRDIGLSVILPKNSPAYLDMFTKNALVASLWIFPLYCLFSFTIPAINWNLELANKAQSGSNYRSTCLFGWWYPR